MLKKFLKLCSFILSIVLLVNMLPLQIYALELDASDTAKPVTGQSSQEISVLGELTEKRTEYTKEFRLSNGLNLATVYAQPVHYNVDGQWKEIDNTLVATTAGFKNTSGVWDVTFPQNMRGQNAVTIQKDGHTLSFYMSGQLKVQDGAVVASSEASAEPFALQPTTEADAQVQKIDLSQELKQAQYPETVATKNYSRLQYSGVFDSTDIVYDLAASQVKESIIIGRADADLRGYRYTINTGDMIPVLEDSGEITLYDKTKENVIMVMPAPFLQDAAGLRSYDVTVTLTGSDGAYTLSYILPHSWMQAEDRQYPIVLDPIVEAGNNRDNIEDTTVFQYPPAYPDDYKSVLKIGKDLTWGITRAYIRFLNLPQLADTDIVVEATFSAKVIGWFAPEMAACVHKVSAPWNASTITWANQPTIGPEEKIVQDFIVPETTDTVYKWNVTEIVRDWYVKGNTGLVLRPLASLENKTLEGSFVVQLASEEYSIYSLPGLSIAYRSTIGVEPYYTYSTFGVGNAGGVYLSDNSGQITVMREVASYASSVNPFSANLVYNSAYFVKDGYTSPLMSMGLNMDLGAGWTLDLVQKIEELTIGETAYLRYYDGDGTVHYLKKSSGKYYDEDGLGLEVVANTDGSYTMSDAMDNTWTFTALPGISGFFMTSSLDNNGNGYTLNYVGGQLVSVVQNNRNQDPITVATFEYNASCFMTSITDAAGDKYIFNYTWDAFTQIQRQVYNSTTTEVCASYDYSGYRLTSMTDEISDYSLNFAYDGTNGAAAGRVSSYWESYPSGSTEVIGVKCDIEYPSYTQTVYHSYGLDRVKNTTEHPSQDDLHHYYLFDYAGRTVNAYTTDDGSRILGASTAVYTENNGTNKTNNHTERTAAIGIPAQNLLDYCNFEDNTTGWTLTKFAKSNTKKHNGYYALKGTLGAVTDIATAQKTTPTLVAGQSYTFSAYVRTTDLTTFKTDVPHGVFLKVITNSGTFVSEPVDYATADAVERGWVRLAVPFTPTVTGTATVSIEGTGAKGSFYADDIQLEACEAPSNYNFLENSDMESGTYAWYMRSSTAVVDGGLSGKCLQITGNPTDTTGNSFQTVTINRIGNQSYVFSGWAKADSVADNITKRSDPAYDHTKQFGLRAKVTYCDDNSGNYTEYYYVPFNPDISEWQYASLTITPKQSAICLDKISVTCVYESNANTAWFDDLSLVSTTVEQTEYNSNGDPVKSASTGINGQNIAYDSNGNVKTVTTRTGSGSTDKITYTYTYDSTFVHRMLTSSNGFIKETYSYDGVGNVTGTALSASGNAKTISSGATYTNGGNLIATSTDAAGNTTSYAYTGGRNQVYGQPSAIADACGTTTLYTVDGYGRTNTIGIISDGSLASIANIEYSYNKNLLDKLTRTAGTDFGDFSQIYRFAYDGFGNSTGISIGTGNNARVLVSYEYGAHNGLLTKQTYGNGDAVSFTYDILGRAKTTTYSDGRVLTYTYTGDGQLYRVTDSKTGYTYTYDYDSLGRLNNSSVRDSSGTTLIQTRQVYDANNQLSGQHWTVGDKTYSQTFTYSKMKGLLTKMTPGNGHTISLSYDALQRLTKADSNLLDRIYTYRDISSTQTTKQVAGLTYDLSTDIVYGYTYDERGNIATYTENGTTYTYSYDAQNQLLSQTGGGKTYSYTYDGVGNILTASDGTTSHTYTYGNSVWKDLLTAFDGESITYDNSGNPTSYYNGTRWTMAWEEGRRLVSANGGGKALTFTYDSDGLRLTKKVGNTSYSYLYAGGKLMRQTDGTNTLDFFYDESGHPYALTYNGTTYYYVTNLQGDVLAILDGNKQVVASYSYDPYGKVLSATGTLAEVNPLRYRGYVYDSETGFYYLQSRYYDPKVSRFIGMDPAMDGMNWYVYCSNSPISRVDPDGLKDYIYTSPTDYYVENDWGLFEFLNVDRYFVEINGVRYLANSKETVTLYAWDAVDVDFLNKTLDVLVNKANEKKTGLKRILTQSVGGELDFKLQMDESTLYLADGVLYNRNEAGNFVWAYFLHSKGFNGYVSGALAQGGSMLGPIIGMNGTPRLDEEWDMRARWAGNKYYYAKNGLELLFYLYY